MYGTITFYLRGGGGPLWYPGPSTSAPSAISVATSWTHSRNFHPKTAPPINPTTLSTAHVLNHRLSKTNFN